MFKVNNRNTRARCEIYLKLTIKLPEWRHWCSSGIFFVNFEHFLSILNIFHTFYCSSVSIVNFQPVNTHWARLNVYFAVINWYVLRRWNKFQKDLVFFWSQQILNYFFWKKWNFEIIPITFTCFGKKIRFRRHLSHLLKLTNLFSKNMSKFRANNHVLFVLIFYSQIKKMISDTFAMKSIDFLNWKMPKE